MTLIELLDERSQVYIINAEQIAEIERLKPMKSRIYMISPTCRAHAVVFLTDPEEIADLFARSLQPENTSSVLESAAVTTMLKMKAAEEAADIEVTAGKIP